MRATRLLLCVLGAMLTPAALALLGSAGCDNNVIVPDGDGAGGGGGGGGGILPPDSTGTGARDAGHDALEEYVDPGCGEIPPPLEDFVCDPHDQGNGDCMPGEACYIYVDYPDDPCGQEIYGSVCFFEGSGHQGDGCSGGQDCAGGYVCVVTGSGNQCVAMCDLEGVNQCPNGTVCEPIDVDGYGGCL